LKRQPPSNPDDRGTTRKTTTLLTTAVKTCIRLQINLIARYKCKKLFFIAGKGLKYDRGTREYFKGCECNKGTFYTYVLQHFIYDREIITPVST
jgi:hypothetical protein